MGRFTDLAAADGFDAALQTLLDDPGVHFFATDRQEGIEGIGRPAIAVCRNLDVWRGI